MAAIAATSIVAQGPQNANLQIPRTSIPFAAGLTATDSPVVSLAGGAAVIVQPDPADRPVEASWELRTTFFDWYNRIHVVPAAITLGNLSGDTTRSVLVWNAYFHEVDLEAVSLVGGDGISLFGPAAPSVVGPLKSLDYSVQVSTTGPAVIDAHVTWTIDGVDYVVPITGRRSVLFPFAPNWKANYMETLTWSTTVNTAWSGREQRMRVAKFPRRAITYNFWTRDDGARLLDSILFGWQGRFYSLPIWHEESRIQITAVSGGSTLTVDTTRMSIAVGSSIVVYKDELTYEVGEVLSFDEDTITLKGVLDNTWYAGAKVIPCVPAIPNASIGTSRVVPQIGSGSITFLFDPASELLRLPETVAPISYQGEEVYYQETDWADPLAVPYVANRRDIDNGLNTIAVARKGDYPFIQRSFRWVCRNRATADDLRNFFGRRAGRHKPVWLPSGAEDFELVQPIDPVSPSIVVEKTDYSSMVWPQKIRRDVVIILRDGRRFPRRIVDVADGLAETVLTLDQGFGEAITPAQVKRVSFLGLYRLSDDSVTFNWSTNYVAIVEVDFTLTEPEQ